MWLSVVLNVICKTVKDSTLVR